MFDIVEFFVYLFGFWLFIFSGTYRNAWVADYNENIFLGRCCKILNALISIVIGLGIPIFIIYELLDIL